MTTPFVTRGASSFELDEDFPNILYGTPFLEAAAGAGAAAASSASDTTHPGIVAFSTGTTATGSDGALLAADCLRLGGGEIVLVALVRWPTLSTVAQEYISRVGLLDVVAADAVDGCYFEYDRLTSGDVVRCKTSANSVRTATATTTAIVANTWTHLALVVNAAASSVGFYVDGVLVATHTANIPTGAGRETSIGMAIVKSAGGTARTLDVDRIACLQRLTTAR